MGCGPGHRRFLPLVLLAFSIPWVGATTSAATPKRADQPPPPAPLPGEQEFNQCVKLPQRQRVKVTLKPQSELKDLVAWISSMTCKRFIVAAGVRAQPVTLIAPTPISAREAYRAFLSALDVMGLTVVRSGPFLKVVQANWAIQSAIRTYADGERDHLPASEEVVTQLIRVRHARLDQLLPVLQKMKSRSGDVSAYPPGSTLILTDSGDNLRRMVGIVEQLDVAADQADIWVIRPEHADPADLAKLLGELFGAQAGSSAQGRAPSAGETSAPARILAEPGSGSLIVVAAEPVFRRVQALVRTVDRESTTSQSRAWVYRLKHADADKLAGEIGGLGSASTAAGRAKGSRPAAGQSPLFEGQVSVSAIKAANALLIVASTRDYLNLRRVIQEIDRPRRQVFVEAYILEVTLDNQRDFGFAYHYGTQVGGDTTVLGGLAHGTGLNSLAFSPADLMGLAVGVQGPLLEGSGELLGLDVDVPAFGVVFQALQANSNVNVLSSPQLLTTDNEEAEILVGQNIPLRGAAPLPATGSDSNLMLLRSMMPSVERHDVGLHLTLTPTIGDGDSIRLVLEQEVSNVAKEDFGGLGASTSQRKVRSMVTVRDRQTVVIGGLISDQLIRTENKIPVLGDIPILGVLFRREGKKVMKTNLLVVLTPHIIHDEGDLRRIFREKLREREEFLRRYTAYSEREGLLNVDYRHGRGLLSEINEFGARVEEERRLTQSVEPARRGGAVRVEPPSTQPATDTIAE
jgi:general secretion pathway protein D